MTREEDYTISDKWWQEHAEKFHVDCLQVEDIVDRAFWAGAEWADAHPIVKVGGALKNYERGYEDAIDKAVEWLDENMNDVGIRFMRGDEIKDIVDLFCKAMKGE